MTNRGLPRNRWYVLGVLTGVYALNIADRYIVSTLIEPIKADMNLSDGEIGFLTGVALAIFYVTVGLPLATLADRTNRRNLVAWSLLIWSSMTAACGLAQNYWHLLLARFAVGVGEAGGTPPSQALLSDLFTWRERGMALSIFSVGASLGSMLGSSAGYVSDAWGWRSAFLVLGIPGVILALIIWGTITEPRRGQLDDGPPATAASGLGDTIRFMLTQPSLLHCLVGATVFALWAWGLLWWTPSYLVRSHGMALGSAGGTLSAMHGIGGTFVLVATSWIMERTSRQDVRVVPRFVAVICAIATVASIVAYTASSLTVTVAALWIFVSLSYAIFGPTYALLQNLAPPPMRAQVLAIMLFVGNIANLIIAPLAIGFASDWLAAWHGAGNESLRYALIPLTITGFWAAYHYWSVGQLLPDALARAGNSNVAAVAPVTHQA